MAPEGVVDALRRVHRSLAREGVLLDLHPTRPFATAEAAGVPLGRLDEREFMAIVRATEAKLEEAIAIRLFRPEVDVRFDVLERFDSADELIEKVGSWRGVRVPGALARRVRAGRPPFDIRERLVLRRLRALES